MEPKNDTVTIVFQWFDTLTVPVYISAFSASVLLLHALLSKQDPNFPSSTTSFHAFTDILSTPVRKQITNHGGKAIFAHKIVRFTGCLILLGLSISGKQKNGNVVLGPIEWQVGAPISATFSYTSLLALISLLAKPSWGQVVARHLNVLLFSTFVVYCYRDVYPLATFTKNPLDSSEGWIIWAKISVLFLTGVVTPLVVPRQYIPVDAKNPSKCPNPDQTASIISLASYSFLNPIIFLAYRLPHLSYDQLPPLSDQDDADHLKARSFHYLDGNKTRHIFFGLMLTFRHEYMILSAMIVVHVFSNFASPLGINRLLHFLEARDEAPGMKPWFWIIWLFVGPTISSITMQWYIFLATRTLVRAECILTQLIFEHSLRIRMKAETPENPASSVTSSPTTIYDTPAAKSPPPIAQAHPKDQSNLVGKINNLATTDLLNITEARDFLAIIIHIPLQITLCVIFLYFVLGWSAFIGMAAMLLLSPIPGYVAKRLQAVQVLRLKKTDARVQTVTETMGVLRMIKLFGWEQKMNDRIAEKREEELGWIWKRQVLDLVNGTLNLLVPIVTMLATFTTYTVIMNQDLNASKVFSSITVFDMLRKQLHIAFNTISVAITGKVSLDRVNDFLKNTELLDSFQEKDSMECLPTGDATQDDIGFRNATFMWSKNSEGSTTPGRRNFMLKIDELMFKRGCINLIVGPTGSGKTSLLMALLGEMHFIPSGPNSWFNLPRHIGVAYAAQESWVQNETIKENILFGAPFEEERYNKVIYQCCLDRDLALFEAGDQTEVGEKGLTLSGGQKARITLARAIYSHTNLILLDDILAALDVHTAKWVVDKCLAGDLILGRTVLLVTHNIAITRPIAEYVVSMGSDGRILSHGSMVEALSKSDALAKEAMVEQQIFNKVVEEVDSLPDLKVGKLVAAEEIEEGHVDWKSLKLYFKGLGGNYPPLLFFIISTTGLFFGALSEAFQTWYLGYWASQYENRAIGDVEVSYYLSGYVLLLLAGVVLYCSCELFYTLGAIRASRSLHKQLIKSVLGTTLRWLDTTPTSRVIMRCTQDIRAVDGPLALALWQLIDLGTSIIVRLGAVVLFTPAFLFPGVLIAILGGWCGQIYMAAQLSVKREMSTARAPVLGHFGAAISGLISIRAYSAQKQFIQISAHRINRYTRAARIFYALNRWVCVRIDAMGSLFVAALATYLVYFQNPSAANTGFSLNMAASFSSFILWWVKVFNDFEVQGNSLERIQEYVNIEQEPKATNGGIPPAYWPASGSIKVENLSAKYSLDGLNILHNISFEIKSGERVGVVGRTGSGKSSLTLALLRCILTEGNVYYDGIPTNSINLDALRSNITIIPQIPELFGGTLRQNLDPFDQYDDLVLNDSLRAAGLFSLQSEMDEGRIKLDSAISSGGSNLSVGQRQILALARAIVRGSKLLILDEATSAIDYRTDNIIQSSLRNELSGEVTLITIAHRLQTIMDADKIMVLDAGHMVEFGSPRELLKIEGGNLRALVDESGDKDALYAMVQIEKSSDPISLHYV